MIEPHHADAVINFFQRDFKIVGVPANRREHVGRNDAVRVFRQHAKGDFGIGQLGERGDFRRRERWKFFRKIKSAIRRLPAQKRLAQIDGGRLAIGAAEK